ncbi:MAG TPA: AAA family ATPase [Burkholderiaceae bacterium]|nr:AAA family ATPase [Burkholderiaceae bacterium]
MTFLKSLRLDGFLSFAPGSEAISLSPLNVLIGPNGAGKSNFIEAVELLHATPTGFAQAIRDGGGAQEWLWRGTGATKAALIEAVTAQDGSIPELRYRLEFTSSSHRTEVTDEALEEASKRKAAEADVFFYYRYQAGQPVIHIKEPASATYSTGWSKRHLTRTSLVPDESVLSQRKDPDLYPELTWLGQQFGKLQTFREWSFGRYGALRQPQPADLPGDMLSGDARNLGLLLNQLEHTDAGPLINKFLGRFLPRYQRFSTRIQGGTVQLYLHEEGPGAIPATRLSDGTLRFLALLALLLSPAPPPLICIEEPELGLHPDTLALLAELLVSASERTQLIVTTHSDALVSALTPQVGSVLVCEYLAGTRMRRLEPNSLKEWLEEYRLGDLWRMGELGGNP